MSDGQTHYTCAELAALKLPGYPGTERAWRDRVEREDWAYREAKSAGRNGVRREYLPPERVVTLIATVGGARQEGAEVRQIIEARRQARTLAHSQKVAEDARRQQVTSDQLAEMLTAHGVQKFDAKFDLVMLWRDWWNARVADALTPGPSPKGRGEKPGKPSRKVAFAEFVAGWAAGTIEAPAALKAAFPAFSQRTLERWDADFQKLGVAGIADLRCSGLKRKKSVFDLYSQLKSAFIAILSQKPHIQAIHLCEMLNACRADRETGEVLFPVVHYDQVTRYKNRWEADNKPALTLATNPDAFKSRYLSSLGRADANVHRLNQLWEMDGTPADWLLNYHGKKVRYTASVVLDLWGRRPRIRFSRTARSETNKLLLRDAVLAWGKPEACKTDNGSDYKSHEFRLFLDEMGIDQIFCPPFSPQKKPHVERFIGTWLHSMLEILDAFVGHNVAERAAIEARRSFAENLFKKDALVQVDLTVEELQALTDAWIEGTYMQREHRTLGMTPFARVASSTAPITRIENERALDVLLMQPAKKPPTISAKGIRYERVDYLHPELPLHAGKVADIRLDPEDLGRIVVRVDGKFLCVAVNACLAGVNRAEIAAKGHAVQQEWMAETRAMFKKAKKGLVTPDALVRQIVMDRAAQAGKLVLLPKPATTYTTPALDEAARALASEAAPGQSEEDRLKGERLIAEARALMNPKAPVVDIAPRVDFARLLSSVDNPLSNLTDEQKYDLWGELDAAHQAGTPLEHDWQRRFHDGFPRTSRFDALRNLREALGRVGEGK